MQRHDCELIFSFDAGASLWRIVGECPLFEMEMLSGRRLELGGRYELELRGYGLQLYEWGVLIWAYMPGTQDLAEFSSRLWAFPDWLQQLEQAGVGVKRSDVVGASGLQALEWHERYLGWAANEEYRHLEHLLGQGKTLDEIEAWHPRFSDNAKAVALIADLEQKGQLPKRRKGRPTGSMGSAIRELYALALDVYRHDVPGIADSWLAACWEACRLRPEWVPREWAIKSGIDDAGNALGPGMSLYRATNKASIRRSPLSGSVHWPAPKHWTEIRQAGWRGRKGK